jgi:hypothetical protein
MSRPRVVVQVKSGIVEVDADSEVDVFVVDHDIEGSDEENLVFWSEKDDNDEEVCVEMYEIRAAHLTAGCEIADRVSRLYEEVQARKLADLEKPKTFNVFFMTPYQAWWEIKAKDKSEAIQSVQIPTGYDVSQPHLFLAIEVLDD